MTDASVATTGTQPSRGDWMEAGRGWGAHAREWAYLFEPYARPANELLLGELGVGAGTRYLDIACGSGLAANTAARRGASVSGLDAAAALIDIARARTPDGDFRVGDMFDLPFASGAFQVVTSFNGIWNGCDEALVEARRVLTDDGLIGMTFWGSFDRMGLLPYFLAIIGNSPPSHQAATVEIGDTGAVVEGMLCSTGFELRSRGTVEVVNEWPDVETAVRALAAAGPSAPAIESVGYDNFCEVLRDVVAPLHTPHIGVRISSELGWVTARPNSAVLETRSPSIGVERKTHR
jgi:SAM-dependent methyltransferase